jgi:hypothetical protein
MTQQRQQQQAQLELLSTTLPLLHTWLGLKSGQHFGAHLLEARLLLLQLQPRQM